MDLRILYLTTSFFPEYSGSTTRTYNLLSRLPFHIQMLTTNYVGDSQFITQKQEQFGNISVDRVLQRPRSRIWGMPPLHYLDVIYRKPALLIKSSRRKRFDIIHARCDNISFAKAAGQLSRESGKRFVLELPVVSQEYVKGVLRIAKSYYVERQLKRLMVSCDSIIVITQTQKNWLSHRYNVCRDKIIVVPSGVDTEQFSPQDNLKIKAEEIKQSLGINGKIVMYAGHMDRINGVVDLVKVMPDIIHEKPMIFFVFIGHGPEAKGLASLAREYPRNVKFLPMVPYSEMPIYYQMCDLFLIPRPSTISAETVTPVKLLEAMAMEKPVLGSDVGGLAEVIRPGKNGYLFKKGNLESLKDTLLEVVDTVNTQIGKNARKTIEEDYTWDRGTKILQKVYEDLV